MDSSDVVIRDYNAETDSQQVIDMFIAGMQGTTRPLRPLFLVLGVAKAVASSPLPSVSSYALLLHHSSL